MEIRAGDPRRPRLPKSRLVQLILVCTIAAACAPEPQKPQRPQKPQPPASSPTPSVPLVSFSIALPLKDARAAMQIGDYPDGIAKARALESAPELTAYDVHAIDELLGYGYVHSGEFASAADYLERGFADGFLNTTERKLRISTLATLNYQLKNYAKAVSFGNLAVKEGFADEKTYVLVSQAYYLQGEYRAAANFTSDHARSVIAKHEIPNESSLQVILSSCAKLADQGCEVHALEQLVSYHSKPQYMSQLDTLRQGKP
jgi:hypothetical protein